MPEVYPILACYQRCQAGVEQQKHVKCHLPTVPVFRLYLWGLVSSPPLQNLHPSFSCSRIDGRVWVWWRSPIIPALGRPRQEGHEFEDSLGDKARPWGEAGGRFRILELAKVRKLLTKPPPAFQQPEWLSSPPTSMSRAVLLHSGVLVRPLQTNP